jgi:hypothetical protein
MQGFASGLLHPLLHQIGPLLHHNSGLESLARACAVCPSSCRWGGIGQGAQ